jgi:hypothetical protein
VDDEWIDGDLERSLTVSLDMVEVSEDRYMEQPFPLGMEAQKRLLELIYNRKSGIITRQELINVLFNPQNLTSGTFIRCHL